MTYSAEEVTCWPCVKRWQAFCDDVRKAGDGMFRQEMLDTIKETRRSVIDLLPMRVAVYSR